MDSQAHLALGIDLHTRLEPFFTLPVEAEETYPLVLKAVSDFLRAECREHRVGLVFLVLLFLDVLSDLSTENHLSFESIGRIGSHIADLVYEKVEIGPVAPVLQVHRTVNLDT